MSMFISKKEDRDSQTEESESIMEGQLDKEGRIAKAYKPRWFVLTSTELMYFTDKTKSVFKESMFLTTDSRLSPLELQVSLSRSIQKYKFAITGLDSNSIPSTMTLVTTDEATAHSWMQKLTGAHMMVCMDRDRCIHTGSVSFETFVYPCLSLDGLTDSACPASSLRGEEPEQPCRHRGCQAESGHGQWQAHQVCPHAEVLGVQAVGVFRGAGRAGQRSGRRYAQHHQRLYPGREAM
jgi:hypothetical protein